MGKVIEDVFWYILVIINEKYLGFEFMNGSFYHQSLFFKFVI